MATHEQRSTSDYLTQLNREISPPRILLADDDGDMRALVSGDLRNAGYSVVECVDGTALLHRLDDTRGLGVDLVIADVFMPGLTGLEVLERLRSADPFTPYIVITAFGSNETRHIAMRLGAIALLDKPFAIDDLLHLIEDAVGGPAEHVGQRTP